MKHVRTAAIVAAAILGGCQSSPLTLEEAQARCTKQGGLLTIVYTQQITASCIGSPVGKPGACVSPKKFEADAPSAAPPAK